MLSVGCVCASKVGLNKKSIDVIKEMIQGFFFFFFFFFFFKKIIVLGVWYGALTTDPCCTILPGRGRPDMSDTRLGTVVEFPVTAILKWIGMKKKE